MKKDFTDTCTLMVTHEFSLFEQQAKILLIIKLFSVFLFSGKFFPLTLFPILPAHRAKETARDGIFGKQNFRNISLFVGVR